MTGPRTRPDDIALARQAIDYLVQCDLVLRWDFPAADPPPEEVRRLLVPYFADGEIEATTSGLLCSYLITRLKEDYLRQDEPSRPGRHHAPKSRPPVCRIVRGGDE